MSSSGKGRFLSWYKHGMTNLETFQPPALRPHFRLLSLLSSCFKVFVLWKWSCCCCMLPALPPAMAFFPLKSKYGARDISPTKNRPGKIVGALPARGPDGQRGSAYKFRGRPDSFIEFPNNGRLDAKDSITILAYVNPESAGPIFNFNPKGFGVHFWMVRKNVLFARFVKRSKKFTRPVATNRVKPGTWNWLAASYDKNTGYARLFVDSKISAERNLGRIKLATNYPVRMGARKGDRRFFRGKITCVQVYNEALTSRQIRAARKSCFRPGLSQTYLIWF